MKYDVFISYSTKDKAIADVVCNTLENNGIHCWIAPRNIQPGKPYAREIINGIASSKALLLIYTSNSNSAEHVINEVDAAFNAKKTIIPFLVEDVTMNPELVYYLARKHWLVAYPDYKQKLEVLVDTICNILCIPKKVVVNDEDGVKEPVGENERNSDEPSSHFWDFFASSTFKVSFRYFVVLLIVVSVGVGAWSSFMVESAHPAPSYSIKSSEQIDEVYTNSNKPAPDAIRGRALQERRVRPVGSTKEIDVDVHHPSRFTNKAPIGETDYIEKIVATPRSSKGLLCIAAVDKSNNKIVYFTASEWKRLSQDVKTNYAQLGVSISEDGHEFIIAPTDCKDPDDGDYALQFGCYGMEFDRVIQYKEISEFIATGYNDTKNIVEQAKGKIDSKGIKGAPAAEAAWNYKTNEYDNLQWYLPSVSELEMIYRNKDAINEFIIRYISQGEGVLDELYWSSNVYDYDSSWLVYMYHGYSCTGNGTRLHSYRVRAVALAK